MHNQAADLAMSEPSAPLVSPVSSPDPVERSRKSRALTEADLSGGLEADERPSWAPGAMLAGKYTLLRPLGVGGMGVVWCARNESTGADVAIKMVLPRTLADKKEMAARFRREAMATARLRHRSIVVVYDLLEVPDEGISSLALVMELLEGETLAKLLERRSFLAPHESVEIACALLGALAHAHEAGIVHRDIKPENVFLAADGEGQVTPKVLDFGISKLDLPKAGLITREGELLGTPSYMSPEQARSAEIDGRSDLFNVGILLYEMLTGFNPFAGEGLHEVIVAILEHQPAPLAAHGVSLELAAVVERALAKDPGQRFRNAREMLAALRASTGDTRQTSSPQLHVNTLQHLSTMPAPPMTAEMRDALVSATIPPATVQAAAADGAELRVTSARRRRTGLALVLGTAVLAACALGFSAPRRSAATLAIFGQNPAGDAVAAASGGTPGTAPSTASDPAALATVAQAPAAALAPAAPAAAAASAPAAGDAGVATDDLAAAERAQAHARGDTASSGKTDAGARGRGLGRSGFVHDPGF